MFFVIILIAAIIIIIALWKNAKQFVSDQDSEKIWHRVHDEIGSDGWEDDY